MAAQFGLNDYGFSIPSLDDLITDTKQSLIRAFGENFNTQTNSVVDKITTIFNEREYQLILLAASIYAAQTLAGAEGIYLDEILGRRGIFRRGKTKGSGTGSNGN
ncbi:putative baseplate component [Escherichia phage Av-05]|uniref:Putative baseplate component n=1 Tax=Escherichia phage Av-05 TaxID=1527519 RepID=A0A076GCL5_9CAUD|nr:putative baseplate component [Escherichia phage Av-05]AII27639.1 putative baseplate component [Escherichia phage Av-05]